MKSRSLLPSLACMVFLILPLLLSAQENKPQGSASLTIHVTDPAGSPIPRAQIAGIASATTSKDQETDENGNLSIKVIPGTYQLEVLSPGFFRLKKEIKLLDGDAPTIDVVLQIGSCPPGSCVTVTPASPADELTTLIFQQIEAFSDASSRGDSTAINNLLDDDILFSAGDGAVQRDDKRDKFDDLSALLKRQTQAFRDAAQRDDLAAMRAYLDDDLLFVNEDGLVSNRGSFLSGAPAPHPHDIPTTLTLTDWVLHSSGAVAVSSYVNDRVAHYGSQVLNDKFLSVDTWIKRGDTWKLLASQTNPLYQDPYSGTPPAGALDEYFGTYTIGPGCTVALSSDGTALVSTTKGTKPLLFLAEFPGVFFLPMDSPGTPRLSLVFQRDDSFHIAGYVNSRGLVVTKAAPSTAQSPPDTPPQAVSSKVASASDLLVHGAGNLAVATFIHDRITTYCGQVLHTRYRSTETWINSGTAWKMLTLQSRELLLDPPAAPVITLSADRLDAYVGTYIVKSAPGSKAAAAPALKAVPQAATHASDWPKDHIDSFAVGPGHTVNIFRAGPALAASANGLSAVPLTAVAFDYFLTPGSPSTSIHFLRDPHDRVTGYILRRDGRDLFFTKM